MAEIIGAIFIIIVGCLGHFLYEWTHHNRFIGYFFPVNESTWEHMKLVVGPSILWFVVALHIYPGNPNLFFAEFVSILVMVILMPAIFYSYHHFTKRSILPVDIASFIVTVIAGMAVFHFLISAPAVSGPVFQHIGYIGMLVILAKYITSTYTPDKNFISRDPITHKYGIPAHSHKDKSSK